MTDGPPHMHRKCCTIGRDDNSALSSPGLTGSVLVLVLRGSARRRGSAPFMLFNDLDIRFPNHSTTCTP
jgi:hypothetical protein